MPQNSGLTLEQALSLGGKPATDGLTLDQAVALGGKPSEATPSWLDAIAKYFPSPRTVLRVGGGIIGGSLGGGAGAAAGGIGAIPGAILGGGTGAAAGEALYENLVERPSTSGEAANNIAGAALGGGIQEGLGPAISALLGKGAQLQTESLLSPKTMGEKAQLRDVSGDLSKEIPVTTGGRLATALNSLATKAGNAVTAAYNAIAPTTRVNTAPIKAALEAERDSMVRTATGERAPGGEAIVKTYDRIIDWLAQNPKVSVEDMRKDKALWDSLVNYRKNANAMTEAEAVYQSAADKFRSTINTLFPKIAEANAQFHRLNLAAETFGNREISLVGGKNLMGDALAGGLGAAAGGHFGDTAGGAATGIIARRILSSPAFQTLSIATQRAVSEALKRNDVALATRILAGVTGQGLQQGTTVNVQEE